MRIVYFTVPGYGHIYPAIPLLKKLIQHKHDVTVFTAAEFLPLFKQADLYTRYRLYPDSFFPLFTSGMLTLQTAADIYQAIHAYMPELQSYFKEQVPDMIVHDSFAPWGKYSALLSGIPAISYAVIPVYAARTLFSFRSWPAWSHHIFSNPMQNLHSLRKSYATYNRLKKVYHLKPGGFFDILKNTEPVNIIASHPALQPDREGLKNYIFVVPEYYAPGFQSVAKLLQTKKLVIYVSLGTVFNRNVRFLEALLEKLTTINAEIFVGADSNYVRLQKFKAANCHLFEHAPQLQILERADLFITHAGFNSANQALLTATPVVAIPQAADQFVTAAILEEKGCGKRFGHTPDVSGVMEAVQTVLRNKTYEDNCRKLQKDFSDMPTLDSFAASIAELYSGSPKNGLSLQQ